MHGNDDDVTMMTICMMMMPLLVMMKFLMYDDDATLGDDDYARHNHHPSSSVIHTQAPGHWAPKLPGPLGSFPPGSPGSPRPPCGPFADRLRAFDDLAAQERDRATPRARHQFAVWSVMFPQGFFSVPLLFDEASPPLSECIHMD